MNKYDDIIKYFEFINIRYGKNLGLENFEMRIGEYSFKSPQANSFSIQIPVQYIDLLELNSNLIPGNRNLFKDIGDPQNECLDRENFKINETILTCNDFMKLNDLSSEKIKNIPLDNTRKLFASYLSQIIISFIAFHELGHVRQLNYPLKLTTDYIEFGSNRQDIFEQQAAEADADVFGINFFCDDIFTIIDNNWQNNPMSSIIKTEKELLRISIYAIFLFFFLSKSDDKIYNDSKQHPHPIVRVSYCMDFIQDKCILNEKIENKKEFSALMQTVIKDFDSTLYYHFGLTDNRLYFKRFKDPDVKKAASIIKQYISKDKSLTFNRPYDLAKTNT